MSAVRVVIPQREIVLLSLNHNFNYNKGYFQSNPFGPFWITLVRSLLDYLPPHYNTKQAHKYKHSLIGLSADTCSHSGPIPPANPVRSQPAHTPPAGQTLHVPPQLHSTLNMYEDNVKLTCIMIMLNDSDCSPDMLMYCLSLYRIG